jgi:hypothetical protein
MVIFHLALCRKTLLSHGRFLVALAYFRFQQRAAELIPGLAGHVRI